MSVKADQAQQFAPIPVTLPWDDPTPAETPVEAKHRRPRTYSLLVTGRERKAINRNYLNSYVWKPALAEAGVIAPLEEGNTNGPRVWEPSREHGFHALRHFYASRCGSTPTSCPARAHEAAPPSTRFSRSRGRSAGPVERGS